MAITILELFEARRAVAGLAPQDSYSAQNFADQDLAMIGGCFSCEATLAAFNAYPDKRGYWACSECLQEGYSTVADFEADTPEAAHEALAEAD